MITTVTSDTNYEFRGLSSDVKPIGRNCTNANVNYNIDNGSVFLEMDTCKVFALAISGTEGSYTGEWLELK